VKCASYINGIHEKDHLSQRDAAEYLKSNGFSKVSQGNICMALSGTRDTAYGRTWRRSG